MKGSEVADTNQEVVFPASAHPVPQAALPMAEEVGFDQLYEAEFSFVWRTLRALGVPPVSLDDAVQDVFVVVHRHLPDFHHHSAPRTWLFAIAYRTASNHRRRERRKGGLVPLDPETPSISPGPEDQLRRAEAWEFVSRFLDSLDEGKRAAFVLTQLEGMAAAEVAESLGIPVNTVYTRLHHARLAFRQALSTHHRQEAP